MARISTSPSPAGRLAPRCVAPRGVVECRQGRRLRSGNIAGSRDGDAAVARRWLAQVIGFDRRIRMHEAATGEGGPSFTPGSGEGTIEAIQINVNDR